MKEETERERERERVEGGERICEMGGRESAWSRDGEGE